MKKLILSIFLLMLASCGEDKFTDTGTTTPKTVPTKSSDAKIVGDGIVDKNKKKEEPVKNYDPENTYEDVTELLKSL